MEKLLALVEKLKDEIVPAQPINKMSKEQLLSFFQEQNILDRAKIFHKKIVKGIRSVITQEDDDIVPRESELKKWRVGKIRKFLREFHKATQILKKYHKYNAPRLRSHIKRHRYEQMLLGDDIQESSDEEKSPPTTPKQTPKIRRRRSPPKPRSPKPRSPSPKQQRPKSPKRTHSPRRGDIIINTAPILPETKAKECCCEEKDNKLDQDFFGIIQKLAPNLYKTLVEKSFILDICSLNRKRVEANVCPTSCNAKAWDEQACCVPPETTPPDWFLRWLTTQKKKPAEIPGIAPEKVAELANL